MQAKIIRQLDIPRAYPAPKADAEFQVAKADWRNGLIVRMPNHLGDAIMALPALAALKSLLPKFCALAVLAPANQKQLYEALPHLVDKIFEIDAHRFFDRKTRRLIHIFRAGAGVLFNNSFRDAVALKMAKVPRLFGYDARCRKFLFAGTLPLPKRPRHKAMEIHQANLYYAVAEAFGADKWNGQMVDFQLNPAIGLPEKLIPFARHPQLLVIASGAAYGAAKRYGADSYHIIAKKWIDQDGVVAVVGSAGEAAIGEEVIKGFPPESAINVCGKTDLAQLMKLLQCSRVAVANDSGTMHLAAALRVPGATVFGPTDYTSTAPVGNWSLILSPTQCAPCLRRVCPRGDHLCMAQMPPETVAEELFRLAEIKSDGTRE